MVGLKEYIGANPTLHQQDATTVVHPKISGVSMTSADFENMEVQDEFYDAIADESSTSDEESDEEQLDQKEQRVKLKNVSWAITNLALKRTAGQHSFVSYYWQGIKDLKAL
ncbi:pleckstrin-like [Sesbania bispinosa]|nr:pleckstrin-like [Sesbania bispinosa]